MNRPVSPNNAADAKFLIYGGAGAVGGACAALLHQRGYALHLVGRDEGLIKDVSGETSSSYTIGDVTDESLFDRAVADADAPLAGLVYAVGTIQLGPLTRVSSSQIQEDFKINAMGAALAVQVPQRAG